MPSKPSRWVIAVGTLIPASRLDASLTCRSDPQSYLNRESLMNRPPPPRPKMTQPNKDLSHLSNQPEHSISPSGTPLRWLPPPSARLNLITCQLLRMRITQLAKTMNCLSETLTASSLPRPVSTRAFPALPGRTSQSRRSYQKDPPLASVVAGPVESALWENRTTRPRRRISA